MSEAGPQARRAPRGGSLRLRRRTAGLSQRQLAALVGCSPQMVSHLEHSRRNPGSPLAERIDQVLDQATGGTP